MYVGEGRRTERERALPTAAERNTVLYTQYTHRLHSVEVLSLTWPVPGAGARWKFDPAVGSLQQMESGESDQ